ncbi:MAG: hypothetical protein HOV68_01525, partial [Streptomycetaceae bacterium]|nr:hypothetical protein [Streptomycetaceae bacterium]
TGAARDQLKCIADVTGGSYADADNAEALSANLGTLFRHAWRTYEATGTPVKGSTDGCQNAPLIAPGQYLDTLVGDKHLYYKVKKRPDQLLQVSATVVLTHRYTRNSNITVLAGPMTAEKEPKGWLRGFSMVTGWANVLSAGARSEAPEPGKTPTPTPDDVGCVMIDNNVNDAGEEPFPVELLVGLADADPAHYGTAPAPQTRTGPAAEGGFSFNSATPIGPGTYRQSIAVGEFPMWRVDVKPGQRLTVKGGIQVPPDHGFGTTSAFTVATYNPMRMATMCAPDYSGRVEFFARQGGRFEQVCGPWEIARKDDIPTETAKYTEPGTYYIQLAVAEANEDKKGVIVPIDLTVTLDGTPRQEGTPLFDFGPETTTTPTGATVVAGGPGATAPGATAPATGDPTDPSLDGKNAAKKDDGSPVADFALPAGIVAAVLLLGGAGYYGLRRR